MLILFWIMWVGMSIAVGTIGVVCHIPALMVYAAIAIPVKIILLLTS